MVGKKFSTTRAHVRKVKKKDGSRKIVAVRGHVNKINRKPKIK